MASSRCVPAEIGILIEALEFYAAASNWEGLPGSYASAAGSAMEHDVDFATGRQGERARRALIAFDGLRRPIAGSGERKCLTPTDNAGKCC